MTLKTDYINDAELINHLAKTLVSRSDALLQMVAGTSTLLKHTLKSIFFPFALVFDMISHLLILIKFKNLENKNLGHSTQLLLSTITLSLTLIALCLFFASTYTVIVGALVITSTAISAIYNTSLFFYNLYQWRNSYQETKTPYLKETYRNNSKKYGIAASLSLIISISAIMSLLLFPYLAPAVLIGVGCLTSIAVIAGCAYTVYNYTKISALPHAPLMNTQDALTTHSIAIEKTETEAETEMVPSLDNLITQFHLQNQENTTNFDYYSQAHRSQQLSEDLSKNREFLLTQIFVKINLLDQQIIHSRGQLGEQLWKEEEKRIEKIALLLYLAVFLLPIDATQTKNVIQSTLNNAPVSIQIQEKLLVQQHMLNERYPLVKQTNWHSVETFDAFSQSLQINKAFQSFFRNTSDVKDIYQAVQRHFAIEKRITLAKESKITPVQEEQEKNYITNNNELADSLTEAYHYSDKFSEDHL
jgi:hypothetical protein